MKPVVRGVVPFSGVGVSAFQTVYGEFAATYTGGSVLYGGKNSARSRSSTKLTGS
jgi:hypothetical protein